MIEAVIEEELGGDTFANEPALHVTDGRHDRVDLAGGHERLQIVHADLAASNGRHAVSLLAVAS